MTIFSTLSDFLKNQYDRLACSFLSWRYRHRPYIEYYRAIMKRRTRRDPKTAVGGNWGHRGQFDRLLKYGLKPEHWLFDIGCGSLRGGLHFIDYLLPGHYTGNDISEEILAAGREFLNEAGLREKNPRLFLANDLRFNELAAEKFDYIHAQSVLSHMPPEDIEQLFENLPRLMHANSIFLASFFLTQGDKIFPTVQRQNFFYPLAWIKETAARYGLSADLA